jgi:glycolate oxidase FAD binding subunit
MTECLKPSDAKEVAEVIEWALAQAKTLEIAGHGTKQSLGRAAQWDLTLDLSALSGVSLYEPEELVLSAKAGTPLSEIDAMIAANGQQLAFEPMDCGPIFGRPVARGTLGGALAANLCGPRRIKAGAARDHFLGVSAVSGRGETFKSGGRVVKNVTGYDLCKLLAGSWGTLAAMVEVTIKVLPRPETEETLLIAGLDDEKAGRAMAVAMGSAAEVSGAAHLPAATAVRAAGAAAGGAAITAFRLEGVHPSVVHRLRALEDLMKPFGNLIVIGEFASRALWQAIRDVTPFSAVGEAATSPLWRISTVPLKGAEIASRVAAQIEAETLYDWAGGLVWMRLAPSDDAGAKVVRRAIADNGGHATLVRADPAVRAAVEVFEPLAPPLAALVKRVKDGFDPQGVLGPGRMYAGV